MATSNDEGRRKAVQYGDQRVERGHGGETHQIATGSGPRLTTQQGTVVSDDQNTSQNPPQVVLPGATTAASPPPSWWPGC